MLISSILETSGGRMDELASVFGIRNMANSGQILAMLRIKTAIQRLSNLVRVIFKTSSKMPPSHDDVLIPILSIDMTNAKKVPSIPRGHSMALSTRRGIHLSFPI